jgi:tyrosine-protein kinase Etk/Wzc
MTAIAVARAAALTGRRVLLVDSDLRRASASTLLGTGRGGLGLVDALEGTCRIEDVPHHAMQEGFNLIAAGHQNGSPSRLLGSPALRDVLMRLEAAYDLVVFDTPPVLISGDASIMAAHAARTVLVVRWIRTSADAAALACKQLAAANANLTGVVLSMVNTRSSAYRNNSDVPTRSSLLRRYYERNRIS